MGTYAGQGDYAEITELEDELDDEVDSMRRAGCALAQREADYRKALAVKILEERAKGTPVTIISDLCRGDERYKLNLGGTLYETATIRAWTGGAE